MCKISVLTYFIHINLSGFKMLLVNFQGSICSQRFNQNNMFKYKKYDVIFGAHSNTTVFFFGKKSKI